MLDFALIGFIVLTILVFIFVSSNDGDRERRAEAVRKHPHVATAIKDIQGHPRIAKAIRELEDAIAYMKSTPHEFGGHKSAALQNASSTIEQLRKIIAFRASS